MTSSPTEPADEQRRARVSTAIFAGATLISRVAGFIREIIASAVFGASAQYSAFVVAFQIPNLIRSLVADAALTGSFVPVFTDLNESGERERAWRVASSIMGLILVLLIPLTVLCMVAAPWIVPVFVADGFAEVDLAVDLFRLLMPIVVLMALGGVVVGILNSFDHFSVPALAPIIWNLIIILSLVAADQLIDPTAHPQAQIQVYTLGVLVGTLVQVLLPIPWLRGRGGRLGVAFLWRDPAVRTILLLMLPVTIGLGLSNLTLLVNTFFSTLIPGDLGDRGPAFLDKAFRLYILPQGIFSVAVSTVLFPMLARFISRGDYASFRTTFQAGLRQIVVILLPAAAVLIALAEPVTRLVYERGAFTPDQTIEVAGVLAGFSIGLLFNGASLLLIRSFFSMKQPWIPTAASLGNLVATAVLSYFLYSEYELVGIAVATSIANIASFLTLYVVLQRRVGALGSRSTLRIGAVSVVASAAIALIAYFIWREIDGVVGRSALGQCVSVGTALLASMGVYLVIAVRAGLLDKDVVSALRRRRAPEDESGPDDDAAPHGSTATEKDAEE